MRCGIDPSNSKPEGPDRTSAKQSMTVFAKVIGVCAAAFVLLAQDGIGAAYLDSAGKILFWTGGVFGFTFFLNQDMLRLTSGKHSRSCY